MDAKFFLSYYALLLGNLFVEFIMKPQKRVYKFKWEPKYDDLLVELVEKKQKKSWSNIAELLKIKILNMPFNLKDSFPNGKQCRERWIDHLDPGVSRDVFTGEQISYIIKRKEQGFGYAFIGKELNHPANQVKNAYYRFHRVISSEPEMRDDLSPSSILASEFTVPSPEPSFYMDFEIHSSPIPDIDKNSRIFSQSFDTALQQYGFFATPSSLELDLSFDSPGLAELAQEMIEDTDFINRM